MKKNILLIAFLSGLFIASGFSQSIEITPYVGYTFGGKTPTRYGELKVKDSESYGLGVDIMLDNDVALHLEYFRQPTTAEYRDYTFPSNNQNADLDIDWYQIGGLRQFPTLNDKISPFIGLSLGATNFRLHSEPSSYNEWSFSVVLQGGVKIYLTDRIGLRLHARMLMPLQWGGFGFYYGSGGGGTSVNAGTYFVQGDVGAGLIIRLGN